MSKSVISRHVCGSWIVCFLLLFHLIPDSAIADNIRPAYLEVEELSSGKIRVVWKVPRGQGLPTDLKPYFPEEFKVVPPIKTIQTNDANIEIWEMISGDKGLAGAQIRMDGLKETTTDALVRVRMADGSIHRVVLRPTQPTTTIPSPRKAEEKQKTYSATVLTFVDNWRYGVLFVTAFLLSLLPGARRRGIVLCSVALVVGALCGHALGRLPGYNYLFYQSAPSKAETVKILQGLMLNTYRAFMLERDEDAYDILARSVSGDYLHEVYLQNRERLGVGSSDEATALIHQLDIKSIDSMRRKKDGSIDIVTKWDVYGSVYHQNHVHYRCNTYTAEVTIEPTDTYWKIVKMQLLDEQRVL
ncbi:hypothetical protein D3OALGA1CA_3260 [Olavius algarvensis associated proteobacterium Delta 3]|nr:hypothetical protein D3OALGB2SA_1843 [Olavius algarvensis associated proteobacterium Delta 3]CAB5131520.1 hypothetical protein D3OALGA1CA_3260 [Olavius algarvensis associated proteobacterium Delta 3]